MQRYTIRWLGLVLFSLGLTACASSSQSNNSYWSDSETTLRVKTALMDASVSDLSLVSVTTNHGVVELDGYVSSDQLQELAGTVAQGVPGVNQVENNLVVKDSD
jgi:hyperosmotically inducible protein